MKYKLFPWLIGFSLLVVIFLASFSAPVITQLDPAEKQLKATYDAPFVLHFSHIMHRGSVEDNFLILPKTEGDFKWRDFWTLEFIPDEPLTIGDDYRIIVKSDAKSIWMKRLGYDVTINYLVTGPPFVEFASPAAGEIIGKDEAITVMFDRAMDFDSRSKADLIKIEPPLSGDINYFGLSAFQFFPEKPESARTYEITIPAGLNAIDGGKTTEDYSWIITTPDLKIDKSEPADEAEQVSLNAPIKIYFNGEAPLASIKPGTNALLYPSNDLDADVTRKMDGFFNTEVTYETDEEGGAKKNILVFTPTFDYQPGENYKFVLKSDKDLRLETDFELDFSTIGFIKEEIETEEELMEEIKEGSEPVAQENYSMQFFIRGENPRLRLSEPLTEPALLSVCQVSSNEYIRVTTRNGWGSYRCNDTEPVTINPFQKDDGLIINLNDHFKLDWVTGVYFASIKQGEKKVTRHFLVKDTTLLMKRSDSGLLVWALDTKSGQPIADMDLEIMAYDGGEITRGKTDEMGAYSVNRAFDEGIYVRAKKESDGINRWGLVSDRWILDAENGEALQKNPGLFVFLNQDVFSPGDDIKIKGIWRELQENILSLPTATQVTVAIEDLRRNFIVSKRIPMRRNGSFDGTVAIPADMVSGYYLVSIIDLNHQQLSTPVPIQVKKNNTDLQLEWIEAKKDHASGLTPVYIVKARYENGIPAARVKGRYELYRQPFYLDHQDGAISYTFENFASACRESCQEKIRVHQAEFEFDRNGEARLLLTGPDDEFLLPGYDYDLKITAALPENDPASLTRSFSVHQGNFDLGLGVKHAIIDINESIEASVLALSYDGKAVGGKKIKLTLLSQGGKGESVYEDSFETELKPVTVSIPVAPTMEDGEYLLQIKSQDEKRNEIVTEQLVFVSTNPLQMVSDSLLLAVDQQKYFVGGRAHLLINEPAASEDSPVTVILTYERDGLLGYQTLELKSPVTRVAVPIKDSMMPNFKIVLTRFNRGVSPSFSSVSRTIEVDNDESRIFMDLSYEPAYPQPGDEVTLTFKTYDYQHRPLSSVIMLNMTDQDSFGIPELSYGSFFSDAVLSANSASNISFSNIFDHIPKSAKPHQSFLLSPARSIYFDPLITSNTGGEAKITITLPDKREDLSMQAIATRDADQFGFTSSVLRMNKELDIRPILPSVAVPGDQTILAASVKNISDQTIQGRLEFYSPDLSPKGDVIRNFTLRPGQQTELAFSVFIDTSLKKDEVRVQFKSNGDAAEGVIPLRHFKSSQKVSNIGLLSDIWTGRLQFPQDAYPGLGSLDMTIGGSPLALAGNHFNALNEYAYQSTYLLATKLLLETDIETAQKMVPTLLAVADSKGAYRFWSEPTASPALTALVLLAYTEVSAQGIHIDSIQLNRTIDFLWGSLDKNNLDPDDEAFILWILGKNGQFDTERALSLFKNKEEVGLKGKAFLLLNLDQLIQAGQSSMSSAFNALKAELIDEAIEEEEGGLTYFDASLKTNAIILYALSQLDSSGSLMEGIVSYLASQGGDLFRELDLEETLWTILALRSYVPQRDISNVNFITQIKINGELISDQSVTGNSANEVHQSSFDAGKLNKEGVNDIFVKKEGTGTLYFDAYLTSFIDPAKVSRLEEGMVVVRRLYEITDKGTIIPASSFKKGGRYLSEVEVIVPKQYRYVALTDGIPAGMKISSGDLPPDGPFTQRQIENSYVTYFAPDLPAGVYKIHTQFQAVLAGSYLHFPASIQALFEPGIMGRTGGGIIQIID